ncbi:unnamed protein product [Leptidea sinapis]|uniref:Nab N-terminal domain-containing protein n=1 Tax=Leptidea sinapis TaxID=189913 RepID=A0A5E4QSY0_9NEOP|nr:unnamed protein product [Leptidea sinapis]
MINFFNFVLGKGLRGDDVQQLCDAGEEEFLEIMALVGMASKPLHVRRLQKALQEWVNNPALFQIPIVPNICPAENFIQCNQRLLNVPIPSVSRSVTSPDNNRPMYSPSPGAPENSCSSAPNVSPVHQNNTFTKIILPPSPVATTPTIPIVTAARSFSPQTTCAPPSSNSSPNSVTSPVQLTPVLLDIHVQKLASAAEKLSKHLPQLEPKPQNTKKKMCKDLELVMMMPESDPKRMEEIRKYAAIYGRFDCKRKPEKPLTLHEDTDETRTSPEAARSASNHSWWGVKTESDDADSRCSYSSTSTPPPDSEESRPQVVASRGDSIIAVANPALQPLPPPHPARNHSN